MELAGAAASEPPARDLLVSSAAACRRTRTAAPRRGSACCSVDTALARLAAAQAQSVVSAVAQAQSVSMAVCPAVVALPQAMISARPVPLNPKALCRIARKILRLDD